MKIYKDYDASDVRDMVWSGAVDTVDALTYDQIEQILYLLEDCSSDMSETDLNDFLWFETETIADWLGFESWEHLINSEEIEQLKEQLEETEDEEERGEIEQRIEELKGY